MLELYDNPSGKNKHQNDDNRINAGLNIGGATWRIHQLLIDIMSSYLVSKVFWDPKRGLGKDILLGARERMTCGIVIRIHGWMGTEWPDQIGTNPDSHCVGLYIIRQEIKQCSANKIILFNSIPGIIGSNFLPGQMEGPHTHLHMADLIFPWMTSLAN
jgi:hypothetical protein